MNSPGRDSTWARLFPRPGSQNIPFPPERSAIEHRVRQAPAGAENLIARSRHPGVSAVVAVRGRRRPFGVG